MPPGRFRSKFHIRRGMSPIWVPGGRSGNYFDKLMAVAGNGLIGYWMQNEGAGTVSFDSSGQANNGAYTGVTLGVGGIGDGRTATSFDGSTSFNNIYSAALNSDFNPSEGTLMAWAKVSGAGVWTDGAQHFVAQLRADANNRIILDKVATNGQFQFVYIAGATTKSISLTSQIDTGWVQYGISWSVAGDAVKAYRNGTQNGATQTSLGTWAGALNSTNCNIGAQATTPTTVWSGSIAHVALWTTPLTAQQIATLYVI